MVDGNGVVIGSNNWVTNHINKKKIVKNIVTSGPEHITTKQANNPCWRNHHYSAIYTRVKQFGVSKGELYTLAHDRLGTRITSLKQLNDRNLKKLYSIVFSL